MYIEIVKTKIYVMKNVILIIHYYILMHYFHDFYMLVYTAFLRVKGVNTHIIKQKTIN